jgi:hypothetical protein
LVYGRRRWRTSCLVGVCGVVLARGVPSLISVLEPRAGRGDEIVDGGDPAVSGAAAQSFRVAHRVFGGDGNSGGAGRDRSLRMGSARLFVSVGRGDRVLAEFAQGVMRAAQ